MQASFCDHKPVIFARFPNTLGNAFLYVLDSISMEFPFFPADKQMILVFGTRDPLCRVVDNHLPSRNHVMVSTSRACSNCGVENVPYRLRT
jgi:hypothetical protein